MRTRNRPAAPALHHILASADIPFAVASHRPGGLIYAQADPCDSVMYIEQGRVRLSVAEASGKEAVVGLLGVGAFLGEEALGGLPDRRETATAITPAEVLVVDKARMIRLLRTEQAASDLFIRHILARHASLEAELAGQILRSSEQRVARTLLLLAGCADVPTSRCVLPEVSQTIIAEMVGTTRSHVNRFIAQFRERGLIERRGRALVVTPALLGIVDGSCRGGPGSSGQDCPGR